ncbi:MAG: polysaccharide biosynthesis protein [Kitasatospora sp.]|nr:polysaccharide biosynthesis protein [Kitasatospora sp.]
MSDDTIRLVTIGRIFRRRWRLLAVVAVVGALVGYGTSLLFPPRYTTSTSVLLPGQWDERELLTQTKIATSSVVVDRAATTLGWTGVSGAELRDQVSAKAAEGNIIKISGTADTPERAQRLSDQVAQQFVTFASRVAGNSTDPGTEPGADPEAATGPEALRQKVEETNRRITELANAADPGQTVESVQTRTELEELRTALQEATKKLDEADPAARKAGMVVIGPAARPTGEAPPTRMQLIVGGALLFFLLAVIGHLTAARASRRLRTEPEIAAALGSAFLGTVDVPGGRPAHRPKGHGPRALIRRLLGTDIRWDIPAPQTSGDEASRRIRYRRVCARLRDRLPAPRRLLVVVPDGDEIARRAAGQLVAEAGSDPSANSSGKGHPMLRMVEVSVSRPLVPDRDTESGALVVLSAGSWTAGELAGIAEACADAKHEVVGIVLADAVRARPSRSAGPSRDAATPALAVGADATGGSQ